MGYDVSPLPGQSAFGAVVTGVTPDDLDNLAFHRSIKELWTQVGVIVFRGLEGGEESHLRLSRIFGKLNDHPLFRGRPDYHPELIPLLYDGRQELYEVDGKVVGAYLPWHSDLIYTDVINRGGILRPLELPERGGGMTGFIDRIHAYATLPDDLKARMRQFRRDQPALRPAGGPETRPGRRAAGLLSCGRAAAHRPPAGLHPGRNRPEGAQRLGVVRRRHLREGE